MTYQILSGWDSETENTCYIAVDENDNILAEAGSRSQLIKIMEDKRNGESAL